MYTPQDHDDLQLAHDLAHWVAELVNGVMERNRIGTPMQAISFLSGAVQDANLADREVTMAERYMGWTTPGGYPYSQAPHKYCGNNSDRQSVGDPGHCEDCCSVGHVVAHPELGCGDVQCYSDHVEELAS